MEKQNAITVSKVAGGIVLVFAESESWIEDESAQIISKKAHVKLSEWR